MLEIPTTESLGAFVQEKRKALGLTQRDLASKAGVGLRFVRELEASKPSQQLHKVNQVLLLLGFELGVIPINRENLMHENS